MLHEKCFHSIIFYLDFFFSGAKSENTVFWDLSLFVPQPSLFYLPPMLSFPPAIKNKEDKGLAQG